MHYTTIILAFLSASALAMPHLAPRQSKEECQVACDAFCDGTGPNPNKGFLIWDIDDPCNSPFPSIRSISSSLIIIGHKHRFWSCAWDKNRPLSHQWYCAIGN